MSSAEKRKEYHQKYIRTGGIPYTCVENGIQYDYDSIMAITLSVWAKGKKDQGIKPLFAEFYDQLSLQEQSQVRLSKYKNDQHKRTL